MVTTLKRGATKASIQKLLTRLAKERATTGIDAQKFCGTIKLDDSALAIQKRLRDEWE